MRAVNEDAGDQALVGDRELQDAGECVGRITDSRDHRGLDRSRAACGKGVREGNDGRPAGGDNAAIADSSNISGVDGLAVHSVDKAVYLHIQVGVVEQLAGDVDSFILDDEDGVALGLGDTGVDALARPDGGRDGYLPVGLGDAQVVVGVVVVVEVERNLATAAAQRLTRGDKAAVDYDLDRHVGAVRRVADLGLYLDGILLADDGAHHVVIEGIEDG